MKQIVFLFLLLPIIAFSQGKKNHPDLESNLDGYILKKRGPNKDHYSHLVIGYGFLFGESEGDSASIRMPSSSSFHLSYLSKWRISYWYELGFDFSYQYSSFHIKQDSSKIIPSPQLHKKEKLVFNAVQITPFQRIKLRNRNHSTGIFIDIGGYFGYHYRVKHQTVEDNLTPGSGSTKIINLRLKYTEDFAYGALFRVGFNRLIFFGRYRISDLFTDDSNLPELPRFDVGVALGIHQ